MGGGPYEDDLSTTIQNYLPGSWDIFNLTNLPSDLNAYAIVWFITISYKSTEYPLTVRNSLSSYLVAGGTIFFTGEWASRGAFGDYVELNTAIAGFINQMGGGSVGIYSFYNERDTVTIKEKFLYGATVSPYILPSNGAFTSFGNGESIFTDKNAAGIWARGSLSAAPLGCIIAHLDSNAFEPEYARADYARAIGEIVIRA